MINDILDLSRVEAGAISLNIGEVDLAHACDAVDRLVRERAIKKGLRLAWSFPSDLPHVRADERIVQQILINLLTNAIKFTPAGGHVTVSAMREASGGIAVAVTDTGIGMTPEHIALAFKPFGQVATNLTASVEGTGLGLPLCQRFANVLGGEITLESVFGEGTTATLHLPRESLLPNSNSSSHAA